MAKLHLGLQHAEELPPVVRNELEQLIAAVQTFFASYVDVEGVNTGDQTITLTGDVTGSGTDAITTTIATDAVTYAKMQDISAASRLLGRGSSGGSGNVEEISLDATLTMSGTTLSVTSSGSSSSAGGHLHGLMRVLGDGATTTFNLLDTAEYLEHVGVGGSFRDPSLFALSADGTQIVFDAAPTGGDVIAIEYVIANA